MPDVLLPLQAQQTNTTALAALGDLITDLTGRTELILALYDLQVALTPQNTISQFREATFGGYSRFNVLAAG